MIKYIKNLYYDDIAPAKIDKIKRKLNLGAGVVGIKVIMLASNGNDVFEFVPASMFKFRQYRHMNHTVVGFATSDEDAYHIVEEIINKHYELTGKYTNLREDFINLMIEE